MPVTNCHYYYYYY